MTLTKQAVAEKLVAYLHHEIGLNQLVEWAELAMMDGEFEEADAELIADVVARLGVADTRAFGLAWADCEKLLRQLGYVTRVEIVAA